MRMLSSKGRQELNMLMVLAVSKGEPRVSLLRKHPQTLKKNAEASVCLEDCSHYPASYTAKEHSRGNQCLKSSCRKSHRQQYSLSNVKNQTKPNETPPFLEGLKAGLKEMSF